MLNRGHKGHRDGSIATIRFTRVAHAHGHVLLLVLVAADVDGAAHARVPIEVQNRRIRSGIKRSLVHQRRTLAQVEVPGLRIDKRRSVDVVHAVRVLQCQTCVGKGAAIHRRRLVAAPVARRPIRVVVAVEDAVVPGRRLAGGTVTEDSPSLVVGKRAVDDLRRALLHEGTVPVLCDQAIFQDRRIAVVPDTATVIAV